MTNSRQSKNTVWVGHSVILWLLALAAFNFSYLTADPDLWGHLYFGADHWQNGTLRRTDPYSFTAAGLPWINHEWLCELFFFFIYEKLGDAGLLLGKLSIGLAIVFMIWRLAMLRAFDPLVAAPLFGAAILTVKPGFMIRPQLFSFLLFTVVLLLLHAHRQGKHYWMAALPLVMVIWANLHGGFLMGGLLVAVYILTQSISFLCQRDGHRAAILCGWGAAGALATLLNPYGLGLHRFLLYTLSKPRDITEWAPVPLMSLEYLAFKILCLLFLIALWIRRRRIFSWEPIALLVIGSASFFQQRHMVFFAILAAPFLVKVFSEQFEHFSLNLKISSVMASILCMLFFFAAGLYTFKTVHYYQQSDFRIIVNPNEYPLQAMSFLKKNQFSGNLFVPFDWGEYAIWHLYPRCKVSIDGRFRTVYPQEIIDDHFLKREDEIGWTRTLSKYKADILLVPQGPFFQKLVKKKGQWVYVYSDPMTIIFVRDTSYNRHMIDRIKEGRMEYKNLDFYPYFPG